MKFGSIKCDAIIIDGKLYTASKGRQLEIGGIQVHNLKEIVINNIVHAKQPDGSWIQFGKRKNISLSHDQVTFKAQNAAQNTIRFDVWQSGNTINIKDKRLGPHEAQPKPTSWHTS